MKTKRTESQAFLREIFFLPDSLKTRWCLVEEQTSKHRNFRLGLQISHGCLYLDVAYRRFYSAGSCGSVTRIIHPATRTSVPDGYVFTATDDPTIVKEVSKTYIADIYYTAFFHVELLEDELF